MRLLLLGSFLSALLPAIATAFIFNPPMFFPGASGPAIAFQAFTSDTSDNTTYNFAGAILGPVDPTRKIIVLACGANANRTVSSLSVAANAAAKQVEVIGSTNATCSMWTVAVATGTTGTISVTWSGAQVRMSIAVWAAYNLSSGTATTTNTCTSATCNLNLNVTTGDVVALGAIAGTPGSATPTGYTERYDTADGEGEGYTGGDYTATSSESPRTFTIGYTASGVFAGISAAFR